MADTLATSPQQQPKRTWRWWHFALGGVGVLLVLAALGGGSSPASLCKSSATTAALNEQFIKKLPTRNAALMADYAALGQRGEGIVCSVSFSFQLKEAPAETDSTNETNPPADLESVAMMTAMIPDIMIHAHTNPGQPFVGRITYQVNRTLNDNVVVTLIDFPGARNLR